MIPFADLPEDERHEAARLQYAVMTGAGRDKAVETPEGRAYVEGLEAKVKLLEGRAPNIGLRDLGLI
jgi:hypothetical protein